MKVLKRSLSSLLITILLTAALTSVAYAATQYLDEYSSRFTKRGSGTLTNINCSGCYDGKAKKTTQSGSTTSYTVGGKWTAADTTDSVPYYWYVFIPNETSEDETYAAVRYFVTDGSDDNFYVTVEQDGHKGSWVYLGWVYGIGLVSYTDMENICLNGYWCGSLPVYYDHVRYTY